MTEYRIAVLPGDGIGPEITDVATRVLNHVTSRHDGVVVDLVPHDAGAGRWQREGVALTDETYDECVRADAILMGAIGLPEARHPDGREVNGDVIFRLRFDLDLYAGIRPVRSWGGLTSPLSAAPPIDYVIVRENVEGLYASRTGGCNVREEVATDTIVITATGTRKVTEQAFRLAAKRSGRPCDGQSMVTCVDKANVLSSYAFFRRVFDQVAARHPDVATDHVYVDAMTAYQVQQPDLFDVVVAENMFGDIISDLAAATVGGLGLAASADVGDRHGLFQPAHGSAPTIAGRGVANPLATVLSAAMMLDWLGDRHADPAAAEVATVIESAVGDVLAAGQVLTPDIGGTAGTVEVGEAIVAAADRRLWRGGTN
ncbi:isocitrate/isopropylmalate dehydrogenase family protein [Verrucosispora sp. WMMD573]|uniref:isocitrate/isopropylmalate dehydrogenase family protein n=1 Tax=Verrucosispora sp. WMMD573 TaxID=3015149 RepID=UPI00248C77F6|nr:isocitrate/isopropylmalate dehydrogenase family protein [Verrucosispora sp. WMMD573]WBB54655.1 isocitrate/isopropylmalate dehydrogenase family protein [Verrucosispora sp. WMMD573]